MEFRFPLHLKNVWHSKPKPVKKAGYIKLIQSAFRQVLPVLVIMCLPFFSFAAKRALVVAVSNYLPSTKYKTLHSTNDIPFILKGLQYQGFEAQNIHIMKDSMVTRNAVVSAWEDLEKKCRPGDVVYIFFSCHGQLIQDFSKDETDGYDESLAMYDAPSFYVQGYRAEKHLLDDDFANYMPRIGNKLGSQGELAIFIDACHSGSLSRGINDVRGVLEPLQAPDFKGNENEEKVQIDERVGFYGDALPSSASSAPYVMFSACQSKEVCTETVDKASNKKVGPLSLAVSRAMVNMRPGMTYRQLFGKIYSEMNISSPNQTPVAEGPALDKQVMGGKSIPFVPYLKIVSLLSKDTVLVDAGTFAGLFSGAEISFYRSDDLDRKIAYRIGRVVSEDAFNSKVLLASGANKIDSTNRRVMQGVISKRTFGNQVVRIANEKIGYETENILKSLANDINVQVVKLNDNPDLILKQENAKCSLLYAYNGEVFKDIDCSSPDGIVASLDAALKNFQTSKMIKSIRLDNPLLMADAKIISVPVDLKDARAIDSLFDRQGGEEEPLFARAGRDKVIIRIKNFGSKIFYVNILDVQPIGVVTPVFPQSEMDPSEYKIMPNKTLQREFEINPPFGNESLKLILSESDVNLGVVASYQGSRGSARGSDNPLEKLFMDSYKGARGNAEGYEKLDSGSTLDVQFKIVR